jgi:hypothetical protein
MVGLATASEACDTNQYFHIITSVHFLGHRGHSLCLIPESMFMWTTERAQESKTRHVSTMSICFKMKNNISNEEPKQNAVIPVVAPVKAVIAGLR